MQLSNHRPFDVFAVFPHCLDNEYWPEEDLVAALGTEVPRGELEKRRDTAVHREFMRSLVYSPQVFVGRQSATSAKPLIEAVKAHPDAVAHLMSEGRLILLLMEDSFGTFLKDPPFKIDARGQASWGHFLAANGEQAICSLRLTDELQNEVRRRYSTFFRELRVEDEQDKGTLSVLFAECSGREISSLLNAQVKAEFDDFCELLTVDVNPWASSVPWRNFGRNGVYQRYVWLEDVSNDPAVQQRRGRHRVTMKRLADLAYNHNTPVAVGRQSFTPPGTPDPTALPSHLYKPIQFSDVDAVARGAAAQATLSELLEARAQAQQHFFYRMQEDMILPDVGTFTVQDVHEIHGWPEWKYFNASQEAAMRFVNAADLHRRLETLFEANVKLHERLQHEMKRRTWWRQAVHCAVDLGVAVTAYMGCEALLPSHVAAGLPPALATVAGGLTHRAVEAGIDLCIVGVEKASRQVVNTIGGRQTVCRQLKLTPADWQRIERLNSAETKSGDTVTEQDAVLRQTENLAKEG